MYNSDKLISTFVEVKLKSPDDFLKICESLTRIGLASKIAKTLSQTCVLLHKKGKYYLIHFKEAMKLDGNETNFNEEDFQRRNKIAALLEQWNLLTVVDKSMIEQQIDISKLKIISFSDKKNWTLVKKYNIGSKKH